MSDAEVAMTKPMSEERKESGRATIKDQVTAVGRKGVLTRMPVIREKLQETEREQVSSKCNSEDKHSFFYFFDIGFGHRLSFTSGNLRNI